MKESRPTQNLTLQKIGYSWGLDWLHPCVALDFKPYHQNVKLRADHCSGKEPYSAHIVHRGWRMREFRLPLLADVYGVLINVNAKLYRIVHHLEDVHKSGRTNSMIHLNCTTHIYSLAMQGNIVCTHVNACFASLACLHQPFKLLENVPHDF